LHAPSRCRCPTRHTQVLPSVDELVEMGGSRRASPDALAELGGRYGLEVRPDTVPALLERFGLRLGDPLSGGWTPRRA
jgi:hypothetical protein